jgi:tetratricopeptide (TPR) repeat protein
MSRSRRSRSARRAGRGYAAAEEGLAPRSEPDSPDAQAEAAFFERGLIEERATLEALSRRPPPPNRRRALRPRVAAAVLSLGVLGAGTFAAVELVAGRAARKPVSSPSRAAATVAVATTGAPAAPSAPIAHAPPPKAPEPAPPEAPPSELPGSACRAAIDAKRYREMLTACEAAIGTDPEGAGLALSVARLELERGRSSSALFWAQKSASADPNLAEAYVIIGSVAQEAGRLTAARGAYAHYLALAPKGRYAADLRAILRDR